MQLELFFKICLNNLQEDGMDQDLTQFAVIIICDDSTGCDKMGDYFTTEADIFIIIVCEVKLDKDWF